MVETHPGSAAVSRAIHSEAVVIDGTCPGEHWRDTFGTWAAGGASACVVSVAAWQSCRDTMDRLAQVYRLVRERDELRLALEAEDIRAAKRDGKLAVVLHFQGTHPFEYEPDLAEVYWRLGVRVVQMAYNVRSPAADGCEEPGNAGLSRFGRQLVAEFNRLGIVVDVSHTGHASSMDAVGASTAPCIASHSNAAAVQASRRNMKDDLIKAIAAGGGVIGANGYPAFVAPGTRPTLDQYIDHMAYISELTGPQHVAIGLDYTTRNPPLAEYEQLIESGVWARESYPPPPWHYPEGLEDASGLPRLTERLLQRGFSEQDVRGILGENWLRVFGAVWRSEAGRPGLAGQGR
jgi:membrane dipeptidase